MILFVRTHFFPDRSFADPSTLLASALVEVDQGYLDIIKQKKFTSSAGCTAITALCLDEHLVVANVGGSPCCCWTLSFNVYSATIIIIIASLCFCLVDSRAVLSRAGVAIPLSADHKPSRPDEKKRIEAAGGVIARTIEEYNTLRQRRIQQRIESESLMRSMMTCCCPNTPAAPLPMTDSNDPQDTADEDPPVSGYLRQRPLPLRIFPGWCFVCFSSILFKYIFALHSGSLLVCSFAYLQAVSR